MLAAAECEDPPVSLPERHIPVLAAETLELLAPASGDRVVDGTLGAGGHAEALLTAISPDGRLFGIDRDPHALELASERLARFGPAFVPLRGDHEDLGRLLSRAGVTEVDRVLFDLGVSSMQLDDASRGFSFRGDGPLDMRMGPDRPRTAADLLAELPQDELARILWVYGEERRSRAIAARIVATRETTPLTRTTQLAELVERTLGAAARRFRIHPATRTFQALRIAVNGEIDGLPELVRTAVSMLKPGGRLAVLSYHSLEDRAIKRTLRDLADRCICPPKLPVCACGRNDLIRIITPRAVRPTAEELRTNPRARSVRLRAAERL